MEEQDLGHGRRIVGFSSLEEMLAYQQQREEEAQAQPLLPEQRAITWGDHVMRVVEGPLMIYGHIYTEEELVQIEADAGATDVEIREELRVLRETHARGYRYGRYYSEVVPKGEVGDAHLVTLWPISPEDFVEAQQRDWKLSVPLARRVVNEVRASAQRATQSEDQR